MKKIILLLSIISMFSCKTDNKIKLISDYEQNFNNTKIDLKLHIKSIEFSKSITSSDSLIILLKGVCPINKDSINEKISFSNTYIKKADELVKSFSKFQTNEFYTKQIQLYKQYIIELNNIRSRCTRSLKYIGNTKQIISNKWKCTYTIENPFLNNIKQEITKYYIFNSDNTQILKTE